MKTIYSTYKNIHSCEILTEQDLNSFVAYREVENEKDLSQLVTDVVYISYDEPKCRKELGRLIK